MPLYVLNRDYLLRTTNGCVSFAKGEPTWVVPLMEKAVLQIGAEPVQGAKKDIVEDEPVKVEAPAGDERMAQLYTAFELIIEKNDAKEFTGQGVPTQKAVERIVGFDAERSEITAAWHQYKSAKAEQQ